jgi:hypothetical protein
MPKARTIGSPTVFIEKTDNSNEKYYQSRDMIDSRFKTIFDAAIELKEQLKIVGMKDKLVEDAINLILTTANQSEMDISEILGGKNLAKDE